MCVQNHKPKTNGNWFQDLGPRNNTDPLHPAFTGYNLEINFYDILFVKRNFCGIDLIPINIIDIIVPVK